MDSLGHMIAPTFFFPAALRQRRGHSVEPGPVELRTRLRYCINTFRDFENSFASLAMLNSVKAVRHSRLLSLPPVRHIAMRPRLPVPKLRDTLDRYLESLKPFLLENERQGKEPFDSSYARHLQLAQEFEAGIGAECQNRLLGLSDVTVPLKL
jgi:hypothetical protein